MAYANQRRWRCPLCTREYLLPVAVEEPMACPGCLAEPAAVLRTPDAPARTSGALARRDDDGQAGDLLVESLAEQDVQPTGRRAIDSVAVERILAESASRRRRRRAALMSVSALIGMAAVISLAALRPFELRELFVAAPSVRENPNEAAPLVALLEFETEVPASVAVELDDGERRWTWRPDQPPETEHRLALLGLRPDKTHEIRVHVESSDGWFADECEPLTFVTPPLPDDFPPLETTVSRPERMEPGVTLLGINRWVDDQRDYQYGYIVMLDAAGEVVWYFNSRRGTADLRELRNGNLLVSDTNYRAAYEVDLLGNVIREWQVSGGPDLPQPGTISIEADTLHHEMVELPSGNFLTLSTELRELDEFPGSETRPDIDPLPASVVGDLILEFEPEGQIVRRQKLLDVLDPQRIGYGSLTDFWNKTYAHVLGGAVSEDWSHANAIHYDPRDDSMLISVRHQDCLVKMDRESGRIHWILGDHRNWREPWSDYLLAPKGDLQWPYHQHGPQLTPEGTILLYDNGNYRALPYDPPVLAPDNYSRVVEYRVDEEAKTVEQVWEYRGEHRFYSPFYGEADWLPRTGNVLITDGGRIELADGTPSDRIPSDHQWARILEITRSEPEETVFEVVLDSGLGSNLGWSVYRSERLPDTRVLSSRATHLLRP